ncbi:hypothetical protein DXG01_006269 [Tephrocybe rancida]|nr:hypothetical protein DXG01_006269 [Tephrocybe rancida]
MSKPDSLPPRFADLKREIAASFPNFQENATKAWGEIIAQLKVVNAEIAEAGPEYIPQIKFDDLKRLTAEEIAKVKRRGSVVIRDVVSDAEALQWKEQLREFAKANPDAIGLPEDNKQFFMLYWTKPQVEARSHLHLLEASTWLNNLYHTNSDVTIEGVDLSTPLTYADRFRIRHPGSSWDLHPPHVDGGTIERWEDPAFRQCFSSILSGNWRSHDPYDLQGRVAASTSSETAPTQGTLRVYPDVLLANSYLILRPFFRPTLLADSPDYLKAETWEFDISSPDFPGILPRDGGYYGPRPTPELHPHLELEKTMTSVPKVYPGDTVFWHADIIHAVEHEHTGTGDSSVMYIPAVPLTPLNQKYIERQRETFLKGECPPDFPKGPGEASFIGVGKADDILAPAGRRAMGLPISVA